MAKRKRKMTLFDVMNTGRTSGIQVKDRSAAHREGAMRDSRALRDQATGRSSTGTSRRGGPISAAEELASLRRELGARPAEASVDPHRAELQSRAIPLEPAPETPVVKVRPPRAPRKPISQSVRETWATVSPHVAKATDSAGRGVRAVGRGTSTAAAASWQQARRVTELDTRYLITAGVALSAIALLSGAFYVGRLLSKRPANDVIALDGTRPDVLNVGGSSARSNDTAVGNLAERPTQARLVERPAEPTPAKTVTPDPAVFGGRDPNLNYLIIDRYETAADAAAANEVLAKYKISATVEKNLPHWGKDSARDRFYLVGTEGFTKVSGAAYQAYVDSIVKVGEREAGNSLPTKLSPAPYKFLRSPGN